MSWSLLDAANDKDALQAIQLAMLDDPPCYPPTPEGLAGLAPGDRVKLGFRTSDPANPPVDLATEQPLPWLFGSEQMWVLITKRNCCAFRGILLNQPMGINGLNNGDKIQFSASNVLVFRKTYGFNSFVHKLLAWLS